MSIPFFALTKAAFLKSCAALAAILLVITLIVRGKYEELPDGGPNVGDE